MRETSAVARESGIPTIDSNDSGAPVALSVGPVREALAVNRESGAPPAVLFAGRVGEALTVAGS